MIVPLLPALDLGIFPHGQLVHDRYFYLPSFGAALLAAMALEKLAQNVRAPLVFGYPRAFAVAVLAVLILLCYSAANASSYWADDYIRFRGIEVAAGQVHCVGELSRVEGVERIPLLLTTTLGAAARDGRPAVPSIAAAPAITLHRRHMPAPRRLPRSRYVIS